jgi:hypothetical protein
LRTHPRPQMRSQPSPQPVPTVNSVNLEKEIQTLRSELENITKLLQTFMVHQNSTTTTSNQTDEDSLADVSIDSREYLQRHNLF